jgi:hypothetical protein
MRELLVRDMQLVNLTYWDPVSFKGVNSFGFVEHESWPRARNLAMGPESRPMGLKNADGPERSRMGRPLNCYSTSNMGRLSVHHLSESTKSGSNPYLL